MVPAPLRQALGIKEGDEFLAEVEQGKLVLRRYDQLDEKLWAQFSKIKGSLADELIRERRAEAKRETGR